MVLTRGQLQRQEQAEEQVSASEPAPSVLGEKSLNAMPEQTAPVAKPRVRLLGRFALYCMG